MMRLTQVLHYFQGHRYRRGIFIGLMLKLGLMIVIAGYCFTHKGPEAMAAPMLEEAWTVS